VCLLRDRICHDAINSNRREEQGHSSKNAQKKRVEPGSGNGRTDDLRHRANVSHSQIGIKRMNLADDCGSQRSRIRLR